PLTRTFSLSPGRSGSANARGSRRRPLSGRVRMSATAPFWARGAARSGSSMRGRFTREIPRSRSGRGVSGSRKTARPKWRQCVWRAIEGQMRITCVIGPFLPVPPLMGGAVERIFLALSTEFARRGHDVTVISRRFKGLANREVVDGVRHIRLPSHDAPASRVRYRLIDILYALRVRAVLPASDVTITHSVFLPLVTPRRRAGQLYVSVGRFPKKQMGFYRRADRLQAVSTHIGAAIRDQSPSV